MTFHSFKNVKIVRANLKAHSFALYKDGRKLNHFAFREGFHCHFKYVEYNFSDIITTSTLIMNRICHFLMPCSCVITIQRSYVNIIKCSLLVIRHNRMKCLRNEIFRISNKHE